MENPAKEVPKVIEGLVGRPSLAQQRQILHRYFAPDCEFYHIYINTRGLEDLSSMYQFAETMFNYQGVKFHTVAYDAAQEVVAVRMTVRIRPWIRLGTPVDLEFFTMLELEKFQDEDGRELKRIKVQRDFFQRSPLLQAIPFFGEIYSWNLWRDLLGRVDAAFFRLVQRLVAWV
ncbi:hypothetical protein SELMODRAFT_440311 [Selaginella moellendorffii]|uniref:SigF-like NTF2-like domain-containing protein n=1 Tax=Selaginella moellendorffii TaxID=88036 RepID=D8RAX9_SELML|nr:uncharacterized protein LOC9650110 [Selaginella moellendorffii]EFJ30391.1 hypothetical protein SELMODRAFT_440311 [Selaginella moellendorffii]|eukprot:XP_002968137.1 uncharacterized protein LOC9650110 [Selaginella moellendorffii]